MLDASEEEISSIHEIGPSISGSIKSFFSDKHNLKVIQRLREHNLNFKSEKKIARQTSFMGKTFVLTGTLSKFSREEAEEKISNFGGKSVSSVSKKTDFVLVGENPGSKLAKAQTLGVKIINENEFVKMLEEAELK